MPVESSADRKPDKWKHDLRQVVFLLVLLLTRTRAADAQATNRLDSRVIGTFGSQELEDGESSIGGFKSTLPQVHPRKSQTQEQVKSFIDSLSSNDAMFEVVIGQGRILTLKQDIGRPDNGSPLIAVGDPSVLEFTVLGARHLRLTGQRIGVTDLSISTGTGQTYSFEVQVVSDLNVLRAQLKSIFPDADLELRQIRDHVVVGGTARSSDEAGAIVETVQAYLDSIEATQKRSEAIKSQTEGVVTRGTTRKHTEPKQPQDEGQGVVTPDESSVATRAENPGPATRPVIRPKVINLISVQDPLIELERKLQEKFPDASLTLTWVGSRVAVEGEARDGVQVSRIIDMVVGYLKGLPGRQEKGASAFDAHAADGGTVSQSLNNFGSISGGSSPQSDKDSEFPVINLIRVPGSQQVMLKVQIAELNRTALRQFGFEFLFADQTTSLGTNIVGSATDIVRDMGAVVFNFDEGTTVAGRLRRSNGSFQYTLNALRRNDLLKILAEPNLVAMNGHEASFLAGGEVGFTVAGVGATSIERKEFGVRLSFTPNILDGDIIRLEVAPEVSSILRAQGQEAYRLDKRNAHTTVELRQGQTLAIAGLLRIDLSGKTARIPGLGDLPVLGPFFSNNESGRTEKELLVLVTPHLIEPMKSESVPGRPGDDVNEPNDLEFYLLGRIEGRTGVDFRSTTKWDDPLHLVELLKLQRKHIHGPCGFSE